MSMTKRHIDSLPQAEQDAILGKHNPEEDGVDADYEAYWAARESDTQTIEPPIGADEYPDYSDLEY